MRVIFEIEMEIDESDSLDLDFIMNRMAEAIDQYRLEGELIDSQDIESRIESIFLRYDEERQQSV